MTNTILITALSLAAAAAAQAGAVSVPSGKGPAPRIEAAPSTCNSRYDFVEALYGYTDFDDGFADHSNSVAFKFCKCLTNNLVALGSAQYADVSLVDDGNVDMWSYTLGLGYVVPIAENFDLVPEVMGAYTTSDDYDSWGTTVGLVARFFASESVEIYGAGAWNHTFEDDEDNFVGTLGVVIGLAGPAKLNLGGTISEDALGAYAGIRIGF